jgi:hypothetical protein
MRLINDADAEIHVRELILVFGVKVIRNNQHFSGLKETLIAFHYDLQLVGVEVVFKPLRNLVLPIISEGRRANDKKRPVSDVVSGQ